MPANAKVNGLWKSVESLFAKVNNTWRDVAEGFAKVNGTWQQFFAASNPYIITATTLTGTNALRAYEWNPGFGTGYSSPTNATRGFSIQWSIDGSAVVMTTNASPGLQAYNFNNGFGSKLSVPSINVSVAQLDFSPDGQYISLSRADSSDNTKIGIIDWNPGFGTLSLTNNSEFALSSRFKPQQDAVAFGDGTDPRISVYSFSGGSLGGKFASAGNISGVFYGQTVNWTPAGDVVGVGVLDSNPHIWEWDNGFGTKFATANPSLRGSDVEYMEWSPDSNYVGFTSDGDGGNFYMLEVRNWSANGIGTKVADPANFTGGESGYFRWSDDGGSIAVAGVNAPRLDTFSWNNGFGTRFSNPGLSIPDATSEVDFTLG